MVIVPLLTLGFGVDLRYAIGASLVSVIATSSAAAAAYVRDGYSNLRIGMFLEVATTLGAVGGAVAASRLPLSLVAVVFGAVLLCPPTCRCAARATLCPTRDPTRSPLGSAWIRAIPDPAGLSTTT